MDRIMRVRVTQTHPGLKKVDDFIVPACEHPNEAIVNLLLRSGAQVNRSSSLGVSPLHEACRLGQVELCRLLLAAGADLHAKTIYGVQPVFTAAQHGHVDVLHLLAERGQSYKPVHE